MGGIRIGRILGIELRLHPSWFVIALLVVWLLATAALPADFPDIAAAQRLVMALGITLLFFLSLLAHELGHSVVAMRRGIPVHRITFFLFGGMAQTSMDSRSPGEEFVIAVAGPIVSFLLVGLCVALWWVGATVGWSPALLGSVLYIGALNLILGVFNLLPGFPMDGGRILRAVIWALTGDVTRATRWASWVGVALAGLLVGFGLWRAVRGEIMGGLWLVLIAIFIGHAARMAYRQHLLARAQTSLLERWDAHSLSES